jgi:hypothetical protein
LYSYPNLAVVVALVVVVELVDPTHRLTPFRERDVTLGGGTLPPSNVIFSQCYKTFIFITNDPF